MEVLQLTFMLNESKKWKWKRESCLLVPQHLERGSMRGAAQTGQKFPTASRNTCTPPTVFKGEVVLSVAF